MKKKRIILLSLTLTAVLGILSGCGDGAATEDVGTEVDGRTEGAAGNIQGSSVFTGELEHNVTIRVLENDTAISKGYAKELLDAFNQEYAEYGIKAVDANMDQYLDLANDGPYGYGPDVLYQANDVIMQYTEGKHIYPLPVQEMECYDQIPEIAWNAYETEVGGNTYCCGVPVNVQAPMLYYRKDMLPENWETEWDKDGNGVCDIVENWNAMYAFSVLRHEENPLNYGYMKALYDVYFSGGFLFSYGGYLFGENNTNPEDIGFSAGEAEKGAWVLSQLAGAMNEECIDNTINTTVYGKIADGTYFATLSTPDVYSTFVGELAKAYEGEGMSDKEANELATENLMMASVPKLPESGDLSEENPSLLDPKSMGGINGYAVSSYTKAPNACLAFVEFATSFEMMKLRNEMLGVAPAREDVAEAVGGVSRQLYENLEKGNIILMPSIREVSQIWTPGETFFIDIAKDAFRNAEEKKYKELPDLKKGLEQVDSQIHDAIFTLK